MIHNNRKKVLNIQTNEIFNTIKKDQNLWELFTKKEEYNSVSLDDEGRFSFSFSKHKNVLNPVVSKHLLENGFHAKYPDDKNFSVVLTHDVDDAYVKLRHILSSFPNCILNKNIGGIGSLIKGKLNKNKSPYLNFQKIIDLEQKYNAKSTFYFLVDPHDSLGYKYYASDLENEIRNIIDKDCEIAYHTRYNIYDKPKEIIKEKTILEKITGKKIIGVRNHILKFKTPNSWDDLAKSGFLYDSSFHYHDMVGFRNGMCHPFYPYDLNQDKKIKILEIPIVVSDIAFRSFMKIDAVESWKHIKQLIDVTEKNNGVLTILWHNWTFSYPVSISGWFSKDWTKLYEKILKYSSEKNAWITNCEDVYNYNEEVGILQQH